MSLIPAQEMKRKPWLNRLISCRVPEELLTQLDLIAADGEISRCDLIRRMLWYYVHSLEIERERYAEHGIET